MAGLEVLVVGSGGREHALGWALSRSESVGHVEAAPGNPGLAELGRVWPVAAGDLDGLEALTRERGYDLVVVGPEAPLAHGLGDRLRGAGAAVFGPGAEGARLESSKAFAKEFMTRHRIPTARHRVVSTPEEAEAVLREWGAPLVVKASGLAAGKGVIMAETDAAVREGVRDCLERGAFGAAGRTVILEEWLRGEEASVLVVTDGSRFTVLPGSQDHKRALDGDRGPNTGGMGAYSPAPVLTPPVEGAVLERIVEPTLAGLRKEGMAFPGLLYVGLMITEGAPRVLEYNVRFGDPETQAVLPRLGGDLGALLHDAARGRLEPGRLCEPEYGAGACVVAAAADYPRSGARGLPLSGLAEARARGALVFHAGTAMREGRLVAEGGRVLNVAGRGEDLREALDLAYAGLECIGFEGMRYRRDIGYRALAERKEAST